MTVPRLLLLALAVVALLALACGGGSAEPNAEPAPSPVSRSEVRETPETAPTGSAAAADPATPARQPETAAVSEPTPTATGPTLAASETASCQLVRDAPGPPGEVELHVEVVVDGLEIPWGLAILPSGDLLVTERPGRLRLVRDGEVVPQPVLEFGVSMPPPLYGLDLLGSEGGLLGVLLHPEFAANRLFYLFYNIDNEDGVQTGRIERYTLSGDGRSAALDRVILDNLPAGLHHQGGRMRVGPDGMLYVGVGAYEPHDAQDPDTLAGKLLRMDLEGGIPGDNPDPDSYIFASGIRNTQGYDWFDDRHIVMVEHGPSGIELGRQDLRGYDEVSVVTAGDNLGWPRIWGCDEQEGLVSPVLTWENPVPPTGGMFYRGGLIPEWTGSFLFTTVGLSDRPGYGRHLHRVVFGENDPYTVLAHEVYLQDAYGRLRTIVSDAEERLYVMTSNCDNRGECPPEGDLILRIGPAR
ncbi:MAG: PQQ-dependent sugar dehydrogenase [Chloroflexi bacterium]|nr:PQQ-dependent sugar dehydrogenase [Chloroflexota bacterium]